MYSGAVLPPSFRFEGLPKSVCGVGQELWTRDCVAWLLWEFILSDLA